MNRNSPETLLKYTRDTYIHFENKGADLMVKQGNRNWSMTDKQQNIYENLWEQAHKVFDWRTHHQGHRGTERYRDGVRAFCKHLAIEYRSKNFKNISDKHLMSFVKASNASKISSSALKTDLAAIRKLHAMLPKKRYKQLENNNKKLGVIQRKNVGVDRAWKNSEVAKAIEHAKVTCRSDVRWSIQCARSLGLRIEEVTGLTKTQLHDALTMGYVHLTKTKGGIQRDVPLNPSAERTFRDMVANASNEKIFIGHGRTHKQAMKSIQNWIHNHRTIFVDPDSASEGNEQYYRELNIDHERKNLTFHGLRHAYARGQYKAALKHTKQAQAARQEVAELLGHGRDDVTRIYLAI